MYEGSSRSTRLESRAEFSICLTGISELALRELAIVMYSHLKDLSSTSITDSRWVCGVVYNNKIFSGRVRTRPNNLLRKTSQWATKRGDHLRNGGKNPRNGVGWPSTEITRANRRCRHFKKCCTSYIHGKFGRDEVARKMKQKNVVMVFQTSVWRCFVAIKPSFCVDSCPWMKHGSTTSYL